MGTQSRDFLTSRLIRDLEAEIERLPFGEKASDSLTELQSQIIEISTT